MRVSLVNLNLVTKDAVGSCMIAQARFFLHRGDIVHIFTEQPPEGVPPDIASLCHTVTFEQLRQDRGGLFAASDVYVYHYGGRHSLMETITQVDGGLVIFNYHNVTPPELWNWEEDQAVLRRGVEGVRLANHADLVLADSIFNLAEVAQQTLLPPERLIVLPLPVNTKTFYPGPSSEDLQRLYRLGEGPVLLYVGRMAHNKRIDLLVELLAAVRRHPESPQPDAKLLLVGDADSAPAYRLEVERARVRARTLGVEDGIRFTGRVDRLPEHYRLASVYVTTSQHEGFCVPLVEAMASGVPVAAVASTAIPETLGDAGLLAPLDEEGAVDVAALADAVVCILSDPALANGLRQRGLARADKFSRERYHERLKAVVDEYCINLPLRVQPAPYIQMAEAADEHAAISSAAPKGMEAPTSTAFAEDEAFGGTLYWPELAAAAYVAMPEYVVRSKLPVVGHLVAWLRRNLTSHLKEPYIDTLIQRQQAFNLRAAWTINELTRRVTQLTQQRALSGALERALALHEQMQLRTDELSGGQEAIRTALLRAESQIARLESQWIPTIGEAGVPHPARLPAATSLEAVPQQTYGINYLRCNEAVGGDPEIEMALYEPFVSMFQGRTGPVLDLGCGRGVFLQLMQRHGIPAIGVDVDGNMVAYCREQGIRAEESNAFDYLRQQRDGNLGGIFCAHVVEHLPRTRLMELADLCWRKLEEGAAVVWITPHGGSLAPLHATFYKDLTHTRPLHPDLLAFILEANGFRQVETRTLSDMPEDLKLQFLPGDDADEASRILNRNFDRLNDVIFGHLDCAAIGWR